MTIASALMNEDTTSEVAGHRPEGARALGASAEVCPRCRERSVARIDVTEWITLYQCRDCQWRYARAGA